MEADLRLGDCLDVMAEMEPDSIDTVITDPPYGLSFMGKDWDHGVPGVPYWEAALRVAKPGAMLLAFGGTRTHHRLVCAIEDAGWEVRDTVLWLYGQGFPKSMDISKAIDKAAGAEREVVGKHTGRRASPVEDIRGGRMHTKSHKERTTIDLSDITAPATHPAKFWHGWGTALKPAFEPICLAMKPLDGTFANNALTHGVAGLHIDGVRVGTDEQLKGGNRLMGDGNKYGKINAKNEGDAGYRQNQVGRFPPNLLTDGSEEVAGVFPVVHGHGSKRHSGSRKGMFGWGTAAHIQTGGDSGSAARFFPVCPQDDPQDRAFYTAKASRAERSAGLEGGPSQIANDGRKTSIDNPYQRGDTMRQNHHPTVKPLSLMEWLCDLTKTPTGGIVLDPFMGSGTTGIAALNTHRKFVGIEIDPGYFELAERRIEAVQIQQDLF